MCVRGWTARQEVWMQSSTARQEAGGACMRCQAATGHYIVRMQVQTRRLRRHAVLVVVVPTGLCMPMKVVKLGVPAQRATLPGGQLPRYSQPAQAPICMRTNQSCVASTPIAASEHLGAHDKGPLLYTQQGRSAVGPAISGRVWCSSSSSSWLPRCVIRAFGCWICQVWPIASCCGPALHI